MQTMHTPLAAAPLQEGGEEREGPPPDPSQLSLVRSLYISFAISASISLSISVSISLSLSFYLSLSISLSLSLSLSLSIPFFLSLSLSLYLSVSLSVLFAGGEGGGRSTVATSGPASTINTLMVRRWVVANMRLLPQKWPAPPWEVEKVVSGKKEEKVVWEQVCCSQLAFLHS